MIYKIPLDFYSLFNTVHPLKINKQVRPKKILQSDENMKASIDSFIDLIIFTHPGECKFAPDFGFDFWGNEFKNIAIETFNNIEYPRKSYQDNLAHVIEKYEHRLREIKVEVLLSQNEGLKNKKIKYFVMVSIQAIFVGVQNLPYKHSVIFSVGPVKRK